MCVCQLPDAHHRAVNSCLHSIEPYCAITMLDTNYTDASLSHGCTALGHDYWCMMHSHIDAWWISLSYNWCHDAQHWAIMMPDAQHWATDAHHVMSYGCTALSHGAQDWAIILMHDAIIVSQIETLLMHDAQHWSILMHDAQLHVYWCTTHSIEPY